MTKVVHLFSKDAKSATDVVNEARFEIDSGSVSEFDHMVILHMSKDGKKFGFIQNGMSVPDLIGLLEMAKLDIHRKFIVGEK
jgi:hypothetical protein